MPNKATALQAAAFGIIVLVIGVVGGIEQNRLALLPGAILLFALVALAGYLVHKSNEAEEVETLDVFEETHTELDMEAVSRNLTEAYQMMSPEEQAKFMRDFDILRKKKAVLGTAIPKTASGQKTDKNHLHCKAKKGTCQV